MGIRKQIRLILPYGGIAAGLILFSFTGCGREKKVEYAIDGVTLETQAGNRQDSLEGFMDEPVWEEGWRIDIEGGKAIEVTIDAEIFLPKADEMLVVEVSVPLFDAEKKEQIVRNIFGDGEVYYNDPEHLPRHELEKYLREYEALYERSTDTQKASAKQAVNRCAKLLETAGDTYTVADAYEEDQYIGKIDGITYELEFNKIENGEAPVYSQWIDFHAVDTGQLCPEEYPDYTRYMPHPYVTCERYASMGENDCKFSEAQAKQLAEDFLKKSGLEYPVLTDSRPLLWGDETLASLNCNDWPANGYQFTYEYGVNNMAFPDFELDLLRYDGYSIINEGLDYSENGGYGYSRQAQALVCVTDQGVVDLHAANPVETTGLTENVNLLPLDAVKKLMKEQIDVRRENFIFDSDTRGKQESRELLFNHMELIYFRVEDSRNANYYSYIPVWRLGEQWGDKDLDSCYVMNPILLNAMDGSLIK